MKNENKGNGLVIFIIVLVVLLVGGIVVYNLTAKPNETANNVETKETSVVAEVKDEDVFIEYNEEGLLKTVSIKNKSVLDTITSEPTRWATIWWIGTAWTRPASTPTATR